MGAADQLGLAETAHCSELGIAIGDMAAGIGGGYEPLLVGKGLLNRVDRQIETHFRTP